MCLTTTAPCATAPCGGADGRRSGGSRLQAWPGRSASRGLPAGTPGPGGRATAKRYCVMRRPSASASARWSAPSPNWAWSRSRDAREGGWFGTGDWAVEKTSRPDPDPFFCFPFCPLFVSLLNIICSLPVGVLAVRASEQVLQAGHQE
jgi:hypothetical protein